MKNDLKIQDSKCKRSRTNFSTRQLHTLETVFEQSQYPDVTILNKLATGMDLTVEKVCTWFQNRRSKFRKSCKIGHVSWMRQQLYSNDAQEKNIKSVPLSTEDGVPTVLERKPGKKRDSNSPVASSTKSYTAAPAMAEGALTNAGLACTYPRVSDMDMMMASAQSLMQYSHSQHGDYAVDPCYHAPGYDYHQAWPITTAATYTSHSTSTSYANQGDNTTATYTSIDRVAMPATQPMYSPSQAHPIMHNPHPGEYYPQHSLNPNYLPMGM